LAAEYGEPLSERELEITGLVAQGLTNREVAEQLYLSHNTVKVHLRNIFTKTGVASRTELSMLAVQEGWITVPGVSAEPAPEATAPVGAEASTVPPTADRTWWPKWPWQRWVSLGCGLGLALAIFLLPQRYSAPVASVGPGDIFGTDDPVPNLLAPATGEGWQELAPLPVRRAGMGTVAYAGRIFVIGGMTDDGTSGRVDIYDLTADAWEQGSPRPIELSNLGAVAVGDRIWVPGGYDDSLEASKATSSYTPEQDTWSESSPMPTPLCAYAIATYEDKIYLFGGWDGQAYRAITLVYTPADDVWRVVAPPQQARGFGAAAVLSDRIFYVGGFDGDREWTTCEVYFPASDRWESCPSMLQPRGGLSLVTAGGRLYAIGGGWHAPLGFNERYTPATNQWNVMETPIVGEWRNLGAVPWETAIYTVGGWGGTDFLNRTYAVEIMPWRVFIPGTFRTP
jgi:DNA-binding CsgD family transcriptional regulator